LDRT